MFKKKYSLRLNTGVCVKEKKKNPETANTGVYYSAMLLTMVAVMLQVVRLHSITFKDNLVWIIRHTVVFLRRLKAFRCTHPIVWKILYYFFKYSSLCCSHNSRLHFFWPPQALPQNAIP